jgi:hypothetical protein
MAQVLKPPARRRSPSSEQFKKATEHNPMVQAPARRRSASFEKPDLPPRTPSKAELRELAERDWRLEVVLATCVAIALGLAIFRDMYIGGLRSSNGRIVSFLASLNGCAGFRRQKKAVRAHKARTTEKFRRLESLHLAAPSPPRHKVQLMCIAFSNKFATQSIGSLLVGATPVILKGWRHVSSWFLAFALVQIAPRDVVYDALTRHVFLAFVVKVGAALYKLRKFNFVVSACPHCSLQFLLMVMLVTIDGNNACSRCMTWLWMRGTANTKRKHIFRGIGAFAARSGPVLLAAAFIRTTRKCKDKYGKLLVLVVFLHRNGCAGLLLRTARTARKGMDSPSYIGEAFPVRRSPRLRGEKVD